MRLNIAQNQRLIASVIHLSPVVGYKAVVITLSSLCWLMFFTCITHAWAQSDISLLSEMCEPDYETGKGPALLTEIQVWSIRDLRPLFEIKPTADMSGSDKEAERKYLRAILDSLSAYANLKVITPKETRKYGTDKRGYARVLELARGFARRGVQSYREVELSQAHAQLESAIELFEQAQQHSIDPAEVAQLHLTLGLIAVEQSQVLPALLAFREALLLNPRLRVRAEFDGVLVAQTFEQARAQLISLSRDELVRLAERAHKPQRLEPQPHQLRLWRTPEGISSTLSVWRGEHLEVKRDLSKDATINAVNSLASRVWACLPFRRSSAVTSGKYARVDASVSALSFIRSPVSFVPFRGFEVNTSLSILRSLATLLGGGWHISDRDQREDLRNNISAYELHLGPQWRFGGDSGEGISGSLSLSASLAHLTGVVVTREVGCKYFELTEELPPQLCQPNRDITRFTSTWGVGPRVDAHLNVPLSRSLSLHLRVSSYSSVYMSQTHPFELPISLGLGLGYIFHLGSY